PGKPGQGWHQDSYYIPTSPDTLCGAWIAIDDCDEQNGAMWFAKGSGGEPVYPPCPNSDYGFGEKMIGDIRYVKGVSDPVDENNALSAVAEKYDNVLVSAKAGDVVFFNGHVLHRSKKNWSSDRFRRSFVSHYANARSFTQWGSDADDNAPPPIVRGDLSIDGFFAKPSSPPESDQMAAAAPVAKVPPAEKRDPVTGMTNGSHILARGDTHLPFAQPRFGTPCAAVLPPEVRAKEFDRIARMIQVMNNGLLGCAIADPNLKDDDDHEEKPASTMMA
ncbi:MAG TPA: phytanoyl-CoA dioxygenase family protein, partial [Tepidisphaeraceae bacterium]